MHHLRIQKRTDKDEVISEAYDLLTKVGLSDKSDAYPCELSGGQQQRVGDCTCSRITSKDHVF